MTDEIEPTREFDSVRKVFVEDEENWYYVVVDVIEKLTQTRNLSRYWTDIKRRVQRQADRLGREELYDFIVKFPFKHLYNNRTYQFGCANQAGIKANKFKMIGNNGDSREEGKKNRVCKG